MWIVFEDVADAVPQTPSSRVLSPHGMIAGVMRGGCDVVGKRVDGAKAVVGLSLSKAHHELQQHLRHDVVCVSAGGTKPVRHDLAHDRSRVQRQERPELLVRLVEIECAPERLEYRIHPRALPWVASEDVAGPMERMRGIARAEELERCRLERSSLGDARAAAVPRFVETHHQRRRAG